MHIDLPHDLEVALYNALSARLPAAITAGVGVPVYTEGTDGALADSAAFNALANALNTAYLRNMIVLLGEGAVVSKIETYGTGSVYQVKFIFGYRMYEVQGYVLDLEIRVKLSQSAFHNYYIDSVITVLRGIS